LAEKVSVLMTLDYLERRANGGISLTSSGPLRTEIIPNRVD
jgi:hypothetical protein